MRHSDEEIKQAASQFKRLADAIERNPDTAEVEHLADLKSVASAASAVQSAQASLVKAVEISRAHGRSWNELAVALNVSRQAARQRYGTTSDVPKKSKVDRQWAAPSRKANPRTVKAAAAKKESKAKHAGASRAASSKRSRKTA